MPIFYPPFRRSGLNWNQRLSVFRSFWNQRLISFILRNAGGFVTTPDDESKCIDAGCNAVKPIDKKAFLAKCATLMLTNSKDT